MKCFLLHTAQRTLPSSSTLVELVPFLFPEETKLPVVLNLFLNPIFFPPSVGTLKSKSALMIFDRHANLKYRYGSRNFWCRGYYVDTVGKNAKMIQEYIKNQLEDDYAKDQISLKEYMDPFTGGRRK